MASGQETLPAGTAGSEQPYDVRLSLADKSRALGVRTIAQVVYGAAGRVVLLRDPELALSRPVLRDTGPVPSPDAISPEPWLIECG